MSFHKIAPSILAADYANFASELHRIDASGAEYVHIDIMDGQFVENISFGADVVASMRKHSKLVFDCHLMVVKPERYISAYAQAGADIMTIHLESTLHIHAALQKIKASGMKAGVAINPGTPVSSLLPLLDLVDQVLIMTVNPGFGGQDFIPTTMEKVAELVKYKSERQLDFDIEVDGGIDDKTIIEAKKAGANIFVAGSYLFRGDNMSNKVTLLKDIVND